jgi:hypothetical protein
MYAERDSLKAWTGLEISETAVLTVMQDKECAVCGGLPAPLGLFRNEEVALWAEARHVAVGNPVVRIRHDERCVVCFSQLSAVVGIPNYLLVGIYKRLSEQQRRFMENRFVFGVCGICRSVHREETVKSIRERYARVYALRGDAALPDDDGLLKQILGLVAQELVVSKAGHGA